jgi:hypothetical protein
VRLWQSQMPRSWTDLPFYCRLSRCTACVRMDTSEFTDQRRGQNDLTDRA